MKKNDNQLWQLVDLYYSCDIINEKPQKIRNAFRYLVNNPKQFMYLYYWVFMNKCKELIYDKQFSKKFVAILIKNDIERGSCATLGYIENTPNDFNDEQLLRYMHELLIHDKQSRTLYWLIIQRRLHKCLKRVVCFQQLRKYEQQYYEYRDKRNNNIKSLFKALHKCKFD